MPLSNPFWSHSLSKYKYNLWRRKSIQIEFNAPVSVPIKTGDKLENHTGSLESLPSWCNMILSKCVVNINGYRMINGYTGIANIRCSGIVWVVKYHLIRLSSTSLHHAISILFNVGNHTVDSSSGAECVVILIGVNATWITHTRPSLSAIVTDQHASSNGFIVFIKWVHLRDTYKGATVYIHTLQPTTEG